MKNSLYRLASRAVVLCSATASRSQSEGPSLLLLGAFHGDEVSARAGERWQGLFAGPAGFAWRAVPLEIRKVNDPVVDEPHESSGTEVGVPGGLPVLLVKGIPGLAAPKVQAVLHSPFADPLELVLPGAAYSLRVVDRRRNDHAKQTPWRLPLESDGLKQVPYEWPTGLLDEHCELIWAGDLDGDGRLDLFMSLSDHYNVAEFTLFLSSKREPGSLLRKVTSLRTTGC